MLKCTWVHKLFLIQTSIRMPIVCSEVQLQVQSVQYLKQLTMYTFNSNQVQVTQLALQMLFLSLQEHATIYICEFIRFVFPEHRHQNTLIRCISDYLTVQQSIPPLTSKLTTLMCFLNQVKWVELYFHSTATLIQVCHLIILHSFVFNPISQLSQHLLTMCFKKIRSRSFQYIPHMGLELLSLIRMMISLSLHQQHRCHMHLQKRYCSEWESRAVTQVCWTLTYWHFLQNSRPWNHNKIPYNNSWWDQSLYYFLLLLLLSSWSL